MLKRIIRFELNILAGLALIYLVSLGWAAIWELVR